ncbi:uncharacterized protein LOC133701500 [Populus nigra]|uniref:uncharacterized protein LOC133701500 n=1 Tax=Populus nigra TaxID=3691 RepID=UPI002B27732A|nr:uncharacterized protein LOC133701500 [Populus nigra]
MADNENPEQDTRALRDFALPQVTGICYVIRKPKIEANNFEIKPAILQMIQTSIQFYGLPSDDPNAHIASFLEICDTFKHNGVTDDAIRLRLFPFSLYKDLLRRCPHHGLPKWMQVQNFYNGLNASTRTLIDAASGGAFMSKAQDDAYNLLEEMAMNNYQWPNERSIQKKTIGVHEIDAITTLTAQVHSLTQQLKITQLSVNAIHTTCDFCHGNHISEECQVGNPFSQAEHAHFVSNYSRQNNPYSATYNPGWRNQPNFSWNNQTVMKNPTMPSSSEHMKEKSKLEEVMTQLANNTSRFMTETNTNMQNQAASIRNLEVQVGQLANMLTGRQQGNLPSTTEINPKEQCKAITLRSGKEVEQIAGNKSAGREEEEQVAKPLQNMKKFDPLPEPMQEIMQRIPFPQRLKKSKLDKQFSKFLDVFKKLQINIPFADALE